MLNLFRNKLFGKLFILIFLAILLILLTFTSQVITFQKKSILESLYSEAKSIGDSISFVKKDDMIIDNEIGLLEFTLKFVNQNERIETFLISRKDGNLLSIKKEKWELLDKSKNFYKKNEYGTSNFKIVESLYSNKRVLIYTYPVKISGLLWGWYHLELSLQEYDKKIDEMYNNIIFLALVLLLTSIFLSYLIAIMITNPVIKLSKVSYEISKGDLTQRANIKTNDEIGELSVTFNKMLDSLEYSQKELKKSQMELEKRVELRTRELKKVNESLEEKSIELKELNENLEHRVINEISKRQRQEDLLIQQSKLASMGEMIGNIAHQWRQPLNALGLVIQNIQLTYMMGDLDDKFVEKSVEKANLLTSTMSKTIDDFRNFFKPNKEITEFSLDASIKNSLSLISSTFEYNGITIDYKISKDIKVMGFPNEFSQVILNILTNSKDALVDKKITNAKVLIEIKKSNKYACVSIKDNAGGIPLSIIEKIFEPYFTTKEEGKGTGIGLYMSKIIIEKNMNGKLFVNNTKEGAEFTVSVPLSS
ncbi:ATP-binding protein [Poseidonibacter ostreae]|jgi:signal transduction histidine kinase|uniref:histidine kinase n=3 Tax=Poseidonibacter ostreae TaxID=2654171 RepID=A0A6L4WRF4_9BACT|nr:ATP-binding protein [Poseidonibacter ostreae]KAB7887895.1 HAMP domain-containing protein [Poseidonibacter ostreae]KAB7891164.1 HAMP domain-containing protein [Poseidonibacter ostreae]